MGIFNSIPTLLQHLRSMDASLHQRPMTEIPTNLRFEHTPQPLSQHPQPMTVWSLLESESAMFNEKCERAQIELQTAISSALLCDSLTKQEMYDKHIPLLFAAHSFQTKQLRVQYFAKVALIVSNPKAF